MSNKPQNNKSEIKIGEIISLKNIYVFEHPIYGT